MFLSERRSSLIRDMVAINFGPSRKLMARLKERSKLVDVEEDEVDGTEESVDRESDDKAVRDDDDDESDESDEELALEFGAERVAVMRDSSGKVPNNTFCAGVR